MILLTIEGLKEGDLEKYEEVGAGDCMTHIHPELKQGVSYVQLRHSFLQPCFFIDRGRPHTKCMGKASINENEELQCV